MIRILINNYSKKLSQKSFMDSLKNDSMPSINTHTSKNKKQFTRNHNSVEFISDVEVVSYIIILFSFIYHFCFKKEN